MNPMELTPKHNNICTWACVNVAPFRLRVWRSEYFRVIPVDMGKGQRVLGKPGMRKLKMPFLSEECGDEGPRTMKDRRRSKILTGLKYLRAPVET